MSVAKQPALTKRALTSSLLKSSYRQIRVFTGAKYC